MRSPRERSDSNRRSISQVEPMFPDPAEWRATGATFHHRSFSRELNEGLDTANGMGGRGARVRNSLYAVIAGCCLVRPGARRIVVESGVGTRPAMERGE